ncbi:MAG: universal stress protein [Pirellulaceae bacterium]|nr:universal stress protein [Pirellulaceae bacterium]
MNSRSILVPIDFEPASLAALDWAVAEAKLRGATLDLLHVWEPSVGYSGEGPAIPFTGVLPREKIERGLSALSCELPSERVRYHVSDGHPAGEITKSATKLKSELVVMGTHARHGLSRWIVGSVCDVVLRECPCPVLVCRGPTRQS